MCSALFSSRFLPNADSNRARAGVGVRNIRCRRATEAGTDLGTGAAAGRAAARNEQGSQDE